MPYALYKTANFGPGRSGLATVGYTLTGGARVTAGVAEVAAGTGVYGATVALPDGFAGAILWDTGQGGQTAYAAEDVNPNALDPSGMDRVIVEAGLNARQALSGMAAVLCGASSGLDANAPAFKGAGVDTTRVSATTDGNGNRTAVALNPPA